MQYQTLTTATYSNLVVQLISGFEGHELKARDIGDGKATIGYGYTFNRTDNAALWASSGIALTTVELAALTAIDAALSANRTALTLSTFARSLSRTEAQALLMQTYPQYESPAVALGMPLSRERAAFVSLAYNRGGARANGMTGFAAAVNSLNRAEAWYQLRYNALGTTAPAFREGVAKRRFVEAQVFGLYNSQTMSTIAEAKQALAMLTNHRLDILNYESRYGAPPDGTNATRNMISVANGDANLSAIVTTQTLEQSLTPARDTFITWLNTTLPAETQLTASNINPAAIYFGGEDASVKVLDARADDARTGNKLNQNILVGGIGSDLLIGGKGADVLVGGDGFDTYLQTEGDGADKLIDGDKQGRIIINGAAPNESSAAALFIAVAGQPNTWKSPDGQLTLTHGATWQLAFSGGSIDIGQTFSSGDLGIRLMDAPLNPATSNDILGDLAPKDADPNTAGIQIERDALGNIVVGTSAETGRVDTLKDSTANDYISSGAGNDIIIQAAGGDDHIRTGAGRDWVSGVTGPLGIPAHSGLGHDVIEGGSEADVQRFVTVARKPRLTLSAKKCQKRLQRLPQKKILQISRNCSIDKSIVCYIKYSEINTYADRKCTRRCASTGRWV